MSTNTAIEWTDATWNPVVGCTKVSQGCKHCYAKTLHDRRHKAYKAGKRVLPQYAVPFETVQCMPARLEQPLHWRLPRRVFVNSVSDLFHEDVPVEFLDRVMAVITLARHHTFQVLTKRPERARDYFEKHYTRHIVAAAASEFSGKRDGAQGTCDHEVCNTPFPIPNLWLGTSVEDQKAADERIPELLATPAAVRFLSCEPLLGPVDLSKFGVAERQRANALSLATGQPVRMERWVNRLSWVIVGGESGPGARPMHPEWARTLRDQCVDAGVSFFFKQWGEWGPLGHCSAELPNVPGPDGEKGYILGPATALGFTYVWRRGKKKNGRELDGRTWDEFPQVRA